jgi:hypothetical protein
MIGLDVLLSVMQILHDDSLIQSTAPVRFSGNWSPRAASAASPGMGYTVTIRCAAKPSRETRCYGKDDESRSGTRVR